MVNNKSSKDELNFVITLQLEKINQLNKNINTAIDAKDNRLIAITRLEFSIHELISAINLYKQARAKSLLIERKLAQLKRAEERWTHLTVNDDKAHQKIELIKNTICLDKESTMELAQEIAMFLDINKFFSRKVRQRSESFTAKQGIGIAMDIANLLDKNLSVNVPSIQNALQASRAVPLNCFGLDSSSYYKVGLGVALCEAIQPDLANAAEQMIKTLRFFYHIELSTDSIDELHELYGVSIDTIEKIYSEPFSENNFVELLESKISQLPPINKKWKHVLSKAEHQLKKDRKLISNWRAQPYSY
jgi:hypothetical protein